MRTLSLVGVVGLSALATATMVVGAIAAGCSGDNITYAPSDAGDASRADDGGDARDGGDAGDAGDGAVGETGSPTARFAVFVGGGGLGVVSLAPPAAVNDAGEDASDGAADVDAGRKVEDLDPDAFVTGSGAYTFVVEPEKRTIHRLNSADPSRRVGSLTLPGNATPRAIVVTRPARAFVLYKGSYNVTTFDVTSMTATPETIDLASVNANFIAGVTPGFVNTDTSVYDPESHNIYFLLQNIGRDSNDTRANGLTECATKPAAIVAYNTQTLERVALPGAKSIGPVPLKGAHPTALIGDFGDRKRLVIVNQGCFGSLDDDADAGGIQDGGQRRDRVGRGIAEVNLATGTERMLSEQPSESSTAPADTDLLTSLLWVNASKSFVQVGKKWYLWTGEKDSPFNSYYSQFPVAPLRYDSSHVIGLNPPSPIDAGVVGRSVVSFDVEGKGISVIATIPNPGATVTDVTSALIP